MLDMEMASGQGERTLASMEPMRAGIERTLTQLLRNMDAVPLSFTLRSKIESLLKRTQALSENFRISQAEALLKELHNDIVRFYGEQYSLEIGSKDRWLYEQADPVFGRQVEEAFAECSFDVSAAGRCLALNEWTAAVFHLMRVLERGLHRLASDLEVPMSAAVEYENWRNIIDSIEKTIRSMEQLPKGQEKSDKLRVYSAMAANLWLVKEAWRNHVAHSRAIYDQRMAMNIFNHTKAFMEELAIFTDKSSLVPGSTP